MTTLDLRPEVATQPNPATAETAGTAPEAEAAEAEAAEALCGRLFGEGGGGLHILTLYLGARLGLFRALADHPNSTGDELAARLGLDARYVSEWLQAEAIAGVIETDGDDYRASPSRLAPGAMTVLLDETSPLYLGGFLPVLPAIGRVLPDIAEAYRTGAGVPYSAYGADAVAAQAAMNRPAYVNELAAHWLPAMPEIDRRLRDSTRPAKVIDVGCGEGWAAIELARAFPAIRVVGLDIDPTSIERARRHAAEAGLADRVTFRLGDASNGGFGEDRFDLVLFLESLHDLPRPVEALVGARASLAEAGAVIVMDERVAERRPAAGDQLETFFATVSVLWCLPQARVDPSSASPGTVIRPGMVTSLARAAGFERVEVQPIDNMFWRFYRLI
jgi:SAM-dependent methyltransferase